MNVLLPRKSKCMMIRVITLCLLMMPLLSYAYGCRDDVFRCKYDFYHYAGYLMLPAELKLIPLGCYAKASCQKIEKLCAEKYQKCHGNCRVEGVAGAQCLVK